MPNEGEPGAVAFTDAFGTTIEVSGVPTGWTSKVEDDKDALTIKNRDEYANVIVSSEPIDPSLDPLQYAEEQGDLLSEFPEYQEFTFEETNVFAGDGGYERVFQWDPKDGLPGVTQF